MFMNGMSFESVFVVCVSSMVCLFVVRCISSEISFRIAFSNLKIHNSERGAIYLMIYLFIIECILY